MAAATVVVSESTGTVGARVESSTAGGIKFNREDTVAGTTNPIPIPSTAITNFSWAKSLVFNVTVISSAPVTTMRNRRIGLATAPTLGLTLAFLAAVTYAQATLLSAGGTNGAVPTSYTALATSLQQWDDTPVSTGATGINGPWVRVVLGVDGTYAGGGGTNQAVPSLTLSYDEA